MQTATTTLAAAIEATNRHPLASVTADVNRDGATGIADVSSYLTAVTVESSLSSDLPDAVAQPQGYSTAQLTATLSGNPLDNAQYPAWLFSPLNPDSPYYGTRRLMAPVAGKLGYRTTAGDEYLAAFTGRLRTLAVRRGEAATLTALDDSKLMRRALQLPLWTINDHPGLDGRSFVDYILTECGIDPASCDLEASLNPLVATPWIDSKTQAWALIQKIAKAELATAFMDEAGKFHYWNRDHFRMQAVDYTAHTVTPPGKAAVPVPIVSATAPLKAVSTTEAVDAIVNDVTVNYTAYEVQPLDIVWQANSQLRIGARASRDLWADLDNTVTNVQHTFRWIFRGFGLPSNRSGYRACSAKNGQGNPITNLTFTVTAWANRIKVTVHNPNKVPIWLVSPKRIPAIDTAAGGADNYDDSVVGQPYLWIRAQAIVDTASASTTTDGSSGGSVNLTDGGSEADYGQATYTHDAEGWIQDADVAANLAFYMRRILKRPTITLADVAVVGDPRRQLGDRVEIDDPGMVFTGEHAWIVGKTDTLEIDEDAAGSDAGHSQALTLKLCAPPGSWILGHPTRSRLGQTTRLSGVY